jgi:hypothetical protein
MPRAFRLDRPLPAGVQDIYITFENPALSCNFYFIAFDNHHVYPTIYVDDDTGEELVVTGVG